MTLNLNPVVEPVGYEDEAEDTLGDQDRAKERAGVRARQKRLQMLGIQLLSLAVVLGIWQFVGVRTSPALFAPPSAVFLAAIEMIGSGELWKYLEPSLVVLVVGLAISVVTGVTVGVVLARYWIADVALGPYVTFLYSTPAVALVPLIVLWAGYQFQAKTIILVLFAFFPMAINTYQGVKKRQSRTARSRQSLSLQRAAALDAHRHSGGTAVHRCRLAARGRPRTDRHGAGRSVYRDLGHRLSDRAQREHVPRRPDVRPDRDAGTTRNRFH